ncbi:hypothetical protein DNL40_14150 [Xylanimonas oleitrophica]|uniref:ANTAR domain-containing protein n=1 Tax=Xylanimonas oleitrophica TaxID=2607479 RepID=A0A2W5Y2R7_9MICO|nr:GAF and ANTAR domain-containing protein [Xylanimonas oleitrophica]PZR51954.1 hypothetical protein DNL40_14150 [Xylanimonas oleitrophica]
MALSRYLHDYAARAARALGPDVEASLTVREHGLSLRAGSSTPASARCDQAEVRAGAGPCIDAMSHRSVLVVPSVPGERRWDAWREQALNEGFAKGLAVPAEIAPGFQLGLNLYSRSTDPWSEGLVETAHAYAGLIATGIGLQLQFADVEDAAAGLYRRLSDSAVVEQALGAVMEANACTLDEARQVIRAAARREGVGERVVAETIVRALVTGGHGDIVDGLGP